jgi:hypothetical protein
VDWENVQASSSLNLVAGSTSPQKNQSWGRRKCSTYLLFVGLSILGLMWAPSPEALSFTEEEAKLDIIEEEEEKK